MNSSEMQFHGLVLGAFIAVLLGLMFFFSRQSVEKKEKIFHGMFGFLCFGTLLLIFVGAMVASTRSGMAFMDWPTSNGLIWPSLDKWIHQRDMFWEHIHRLIAEFIGFLAICILACSFKVHGRRYTMPCLLLLVMIIVQGIFGGLTVKRLTSWWTSSLHGVVAQIVLVYMSLIYMKLSNVAKIEKKYVADRWLTTLPLIVCLVVFIQLVLGASFRHRMKQASFSSEMNESHLIAMEAGKARLIFEKNGLYTLRVKLPEGRSVRAVVEEDSGDKRILVRSFNEGEVAHEYISLGEFEVNPSRSYTLSFDGNVSDVSIVGLERISFMAETSVSQLSFTIVYKEVLDGNRHLLWAHIGFAIVVTILVLLFGAYLRANKYKVSVLRKVGTGLLVVLFLQICFGLVALLAVSERQKNIYDQLKTVLTSAHLANGAVLLALCVIGTYFCRQNFVYQRTEN